MEKLFLTIVFCFMATQAVANITVTLSSDKINMGETVTLSIKETSTSGGLNLGTDVDLSALEENFTIAGTNKSVSSFFANGQMSATTTLMIELSPKKEGKLTIPALVVNGAKTNPLSIEIAPISSTYKGDTGKNNSEIFLKATIDDKTPYENAQVIYILRAYVQESYNITSGELGKLKSDNAIIEQVSKVNQFKSKINNTRYNVFEGKFAVFPTTSGKITIEGEGSYFMIADTSKASQSQGFPNMFQLSLPQKKIFLKQDPITIDAKPKPKSFDNEVWLPAQSLSAMFNFPESSSSFQTGEPIDISITLKAIGLLEQQLPDLQLPEVGGLKVYAGDAKKQNTLTENVSSFKTVSFAIIPTKAGDFTIPKLEIPWFNTQTNQKEILEIPEIKISAVGVSTIAEQPQPTPSAAVIEGPKEHPAPTLINENKQPLLIIIGIAVGMALSFGISLIFRKSNKQSKIAKKDNSNNDLKLIKSACELSNPRLIQEALLNWAKNNIDSKITSIIKIAKHLNSPELEQALEKLNKNIYSNQALDFNGMEIYVALEVAMKSQAKAKGLKNKIPDLYPF